MKFDKRAELVILVVLIVLSLIIVWPFIIPILSGVLFAYIFKPIYNKLVKLTKKQMLSSILTILLFFLIIIIPFLFIINSLVGEAYTIYRDSTNIAEESALLFEDTPLNFANRINETLGINIDIEQIIKNIALFLLNKSQNILTIISKQILNFFIILFVMYYSLINWNVLKEHTTKHLPIKEHIAEKFMLNFKELTYAIIYTTLIIALIQGAVGGLGFYIFGVRNPIFWGLVMAVASLIPFGGTGLVWLPAFLILIGKGIYLSNSVLIWNAIGLLAYSAIITSGIDNLIRPKLVETRSKLHPILVLIGVLGGISFFGFMGLLLGPLILGATITALKVLGSEVMD